MLIPLGTNRPLRRKTRIVPILLAFNTAIFVIQLILEHTNPELAASFVQSGWVWRHDLTPWSPISSAFLHAGFLHLAGNMLALWVFGPPVEDRFGRVGFLIFYLSGAIGSGLIHVASSQAPAIGASGAIAAVSGAFLVLFPNSKVKVFWFFQILMAPAWWLIGLWIFIDLVSQTFKSDSGIAYAAHLGGYGIGISTALFLLWTKILAREQYDLFSILRHKQRKRAIKAAGAYAVPKPYKAAKVKREDPKSAELSQRRSQISERLTEGNIEDASARYLAMVDYFKNDEHAATTMHRDGQYQIANYLYSNGQRAEALDAYQALLKMYPNDTERDIICILRARINAHDLHNTETARGILENLLKNTFDEDIKALAQTELDALSD